MHFYSARSICPLLGYTQWRNFVNAIDKAKDSCINAGEQISDHFVDVSKMVEIGSGTSRVIEDILLTRYACYLIAQNGDPRKPEVAFAQNYFAVQTRRAELVQQRIHPITREHVDNNIAVREMLRSRGIEPAQLQPAEDVNKVERRLKSEEKKALPKKK